MPRACRIVPATMIDTELYGGRRAYVAHLRARAMYAIGSYRAVRCIAWRSVERLVFVCRGNICRSAYAGARARALGARAVSFGIEAADGAGADKTAACNALRRGIDLGDHRATRLQTDLICPGDLIVVFEPRYLLSVRPDRQSGVAGLTLLGLWADPLRPHIQDPYGRSDRYFQECFAAIDLHTHELVNRLAAHAAPAAGGSAAAGASASS